MSLRENLVAKFVVYYGKALNNLRQMLNKRDVASMSRASLSSLYLHIIAIYEEETVDQSFTFGSGLVQLTRDIIVKHQQITCPSVLKYVANASKSWYFPAYDQKCLKELNRFILSLEVYAKKSCNFQALCSYNDLIEFSKKFDDWAFKFDSYQVVRDWLISAPSGLFVLPNFTTDEFELVVLYLYKVLMMMLPNLFPRALFCYPHLIRVFPMTPPPQPLKNSYLQYVCQYCIRVHDFFYKRYNLLINLTETSKRELMMKAWNEVIIEEFSNTHFDYYHFLHFPMSLPFHRLWDMGMKSVDMKHLYSYNHYQTEWFRKNCFQDPVVEIHYRNFGFGPIPQTFSFNDTLLVDSAGDIENNLLVSYQNLINGVANEQDVIPEYTLVQAPFELTINEAYKLLGDFQELRREKEKQNLEFKS
ncbi:hypothetical protein KGF56_001186 [Candida oxycetoniae]|uniref:Uncharacterized protein n=1 Tax=Candida oxycetoniae TaxID=497107 RepID=A0AAI9SZP1_9ASCO|nr:uncharacterized protein KGF56_001186 [Candida oxycetoniae]KAI3405967.2 hypothetical protein KGF56_001186 [Candida oxycetoniae]